MFRNKKVDSGIPQKIIDRVRKMSTEDLVMWGDQALYSTGRSLTGHLKDRNGDSLAEAVTGAQVVLAIVEEVGRRNNAVL